MRWYCFTHICNRGGEVADPFEVDTAGLRSGAADSELMAAALGADTFDSSQSGSQMSHAGVAAIDAAVASTRGMQSRRMSEQAAIMTAGSNRYEGTDTSQAERVAGAM
jgi:hypothetical protein